MVDRRAAACVGFLARGLIAAEGGSSVAAGRIGTRGTIIPALAIDARGWRGGLQCAMQERRAERMINDR